MRRTLALLAVLTIIASAAALSVQAAAQLELPATRVTLGQVATGPGPVEIPVEIDSGGAPVRSWQINVAYPPTLSLTGAEPADLPESWRFMAGSPQPGELRVLAFDLEGNGMPLDGELFRLQGVKLEAGPAQIGIAYSELRDTPN